MVSSPHSWLSFWKLINCVLWTLWTRNVGDGRNSVYRRDEGGEEEERREGRQFDISRQNTKIHRQTVWIQCSEPGSPRSEGMTATPAFRYKWPLLPSLWFQLIMYKHTSWCLHLYIQSLALWDPTSKCYLRCRLKLHHQPALWSTPLSSFWERSQLFRYDLIRYDSIWFLMPALINLHLFKLLCLLSNSCCLWASANPLRIVFFESLQRF